MEVAFGFWFWGGLSCSNGGLKRPLKRGTMHYFSRTWELGGGGVVLQIWTEPGQLHLDLPGPLQPVEGSPVKDGLSRDDSSL